MRRMTFILAMTALLYSQMTVAHAVTDQVDIRGLQMSCTTPRDVKASIFTDTGFNDVGVSTRYFLGMPYISVNSDILSQYSSNVAQWWFAHTCGHFIFDTVVEENESTADCYATKYLVQNEIIKDDEALSDFYNELLSLPKPLAEHLPTPDRVKDMANCEI